MRLVADCAGSRRTAFFDDFESGDLSAWDGEWTPDGGVLEVNGAAALSGSLGLEVGLSATTTIAIFVKDIPATTGGLHAGFLVDPNQLTMAEGDALTLFAGLDGGNGGYTVQLRLRHKNGVHQIRLNTWDDTLAWAATPGWDTIDSSGPSAVHIEWWPASAPGAADGGIRLRVNGLNVGETGGLDNHERGIRRFRLGASGVDPGTHGALYLDTFRIWPRGGR